MKSFFNYYGRKRTVAQKIGDMIEPLLTGENTYYEPFVGSGSIYFHLEHPKSVIGDVVPDVINAFECVRDDYEKVLDYYNRFPNTKEKFYQIRNIDRHPMYESRDRFFKAARFIYVTNTSFGAIRYNKKGQANQGYFLHEGDDISLDVDNLKLVSGLLREADIHLGNYEETIEGVKEGDVVYMDPPYADTLYERYWKVPFTKDDMYKLKTHCDELDEKGATFFLSYEDNEFIRQLYQKYNFWMYQKERPLNSRNRKHRMHTYEIMVTNAE